MNPMVIAIGGGVALLVVTHAFAWTMGRIRGHGDGWNDRGRLGVADLGAARRRSAAKLRVIDGGRGTGGAA